MTLNKKSGAKIAMTAAALVVSGTALIATAYAEAVPGRCFGVNGCAGKGACKTTKNDCKGKNACKGQGGCKGGECAPEGGAAAPPP